MIEIKGLAPMKHHKWGLFTICSIVSPLLSLYFGDTDFLSPSCEKCPLTQQQPLHFSLLLFSVSITNQLFPLPVSPLPVSVTADSIPSLSLSC